MEFRIDKYGPKYPCMSKNKKKKKKKKKQKKKQLYDRHETGRLSCPFCPIFLQQAHWGFMREQSLKYSCSGLLDCSKCQSRGLMKASLSERCDQGTVSPFRANAIALLNFTIPKIIYPSIFQIGSQRSL